MKHRPKRTRASPRTLVVVYRGTDKYERGVRAKYHDIRLLLKLGPSADFGFTAA